ncbi:MAG TPA: hypothetical protein VFB58_08080 [Chloroflexota bacterium]|nr:hypothetical protein [Chloroflexota bacterium]
MRPTLDDRDRDEAGRIIYLGDVRRRKTSRRRLSPDRHYLAALAVVALAAWALWALVVLTLPPARLLTYLAFFLPFGLALASTGALVAYAAERRFGTAPSLSGSVRRGILLGAFAVLNGATLAAHLWSPVVLLGGAVVAAAADTVLSRRSF